jgi:BirA family biotin operon repressor/biotin-[acetyl-CoA-carboxylase] ligase
MPALNFGPGDYERALLARGLSEVTVFHRRTTGSTNDDARQLVANRLPLVEDVTAIVIAETQTSGRGRGANTWSSPPGSIAFTLTVPGVLASRLGILPLGVGACVAEAIRDLGARASVKWPNDVLIEGLKVCGILCESSLLEGSARVFIGIGINVEAGGVEESGPARTTRLASHGLTVDRPSLVADITERILALIRGAASNAEVVARWKALAAPWWGEEVDLIDGEVQRRVTLLDVNPEGQLVVRDESGVVRSLVSGEVRKLRAVPA